MQEKAVIERQRIRNADITRKQRHCQSSASALEEEKINAKLAVEIIKAINRQDDIVVEDSIKSIKKAKDRFNESSLLLD